MTISKPDLLIARGGGNATSSGVLFESGVASYFGALMLAERNIDRFADLAPSVPIVVRMETEAPVDDILVETDTGGLIFIQAKTRIEFASGTGSPFAKTVEQFVRQWLVCASGSGDRQWNRPLDQAKDRLVLAAAAYQNLLKSRRLALHRRMSCDRYESEVNAAVGIPISRHRACSGLRPCCGQMMALIDDQMADGSGQSIGNSTLEKSANIRTGRSCDLNGGFRTLLRSNAAKKCKVAALGT